jgi:hypothetical protein
MGKHRHTFGFSFSLSRLIGLAGLKHKVATRLGIPLTYSGLTRKIGRALLRMLK